MSHRVLLTGGTGFVGSAILGALLGAGHSVSVLSRTANAGSLQGARVVHGDLADRNGMIAATRATDVIVHAANLATSAHPQSLFEVNARGTSYLCEAALANRVDRIILVSTAGVYGHRAHRGTREDEACAPDTPYSRSKHEAETILLRHHAAGHIRAIILRPRFVYGVGDRSVIPGLVRAVRRFPVLLDGGNNRLSFVSVNALADAACAFIHAVEPVGESPIFNVAEPEPLTYAELATMLCTLFDAVRPRRSLPFGALYGPVKVAEWLLRLDPERSKLPLSSLRLTLFGRDNHFCADKLRRTLPGLALGDLRNGFASNVASYYRQLAGPS